MPGGHGLGERDHFGPRKLAEMPIAADAAFGENDDLGPLLSRLPREALDRRQVGGFIAGGMLKLHGGNPNITHGSLRRHPL